MRTVHIQIVFNMDVKVIVLISIKLPFMLTKSSEIKFQQQLFKISKEF